MARNPADAPAEDYAGRDVPRTVAENIDAVIELEERADRERPTLHRAVDAVGGSIGTMPFLALNIIVFVLWLLANVGALPLIKPFDPPPFSMLSTIVSVESVLLTMFVLITQNRMGDRANHRAHLDLQINLLTEREVTKLVQMTDRIARKLGIADETDSTEIEEMSTHTAVETLSAKFQDRATSE